MGQRRLAAVDDPLRLVLRPEERLRRHRAKEADEQPADGTLDDMIRTPSRLLHDGAASDHRALHPRPAAEAAKHAEGDAPEGGERVRRAARVLGHLPDGLLR